MGRRGFFAELNHQAQQAEKRRKQEAAAVYRAQMAAYHEAQRARKGAERAAAAAARANAAGQAAAQKLAAQAHVEARAAETAAMNAELRQRYEAIDGLLASTLDVDDYVDLEALKIARVEHPPFDPGPLATPVPPMPPLVYPPEPGYEEPEAPRGLSAAIGGKKRHAEAVAQARSTHEAAHRSWHQHCVRLHTEYTGEYQRRQLAEQERVQRLGAAEAEYQQQCRRREAEAESRNEQISRFITDLAFDGSTNEAKCSTTSPPSSKTGLMNRAAQNTLPSLRR